jgi:hypothetical protein
MENIRRFLYHPLRPLGWFADTSDCFRYNTNAEGVNPTTISLGTDLALYKGKKITTTRTCIGMVPIIKKIVERSTCPAPQDMVPPAPSKPSSRTPKQGSCVKMDPIRHGKRVHTQLETLTELWINAVKMHANKEFVEALTSYKMLDWKAINTTVAKQIRLRLPDHDPCLRKITTLCHRRQWIPIATEYLVFHPTYRIATQSDLVCMHLPTKRLIVIELKTTLSRTTRTKEGQDTQADQHEEICWKPEHGGPPYLLTWLSRHMLQLLGTVILLEEWGVRVDEAYVLRVGPYATTRAYKMSSELSKLYRTSLWRSMQAVRTKRRKRPKAQRKVKRRKKPARIRVIPK